MGLRRSFDLMGAVTMLYLYGTLLIATIFVYPLFAEEDFSDDISAASRTLFNVGVIIYALIGLAMYAALCYGIYTDHTRIKQIYVGVIILFLILHCIPYLFDMDGWKYNVSLAFHIGIVLGILIRFLIDKYVKK